VFVYSSTSSSNCMVKCYKKVWYVLLYNVPSKGCFYPHSGGSTTFYNPSSTHHSHASTQQTAPELKSCSASFQNDRRPNSYPCSRRLYSAKHIATQGRRCLGSQLQRIQSASAVVKIISTSGVHLYPFDAQLLTSLRLCHQGAQSCELA
jgi:hypothetical protein